MYFYVNEFEVGVNDCTFSGNEQQNVYFLSNNHLCNYAKTIIHLTLKEFC